MLFSRVALIVSVLCASGLAAPAGGATNTDLTQSQPASGSNLATHQQHAAVAGTTNTDAGLTPPADDSTATHPNSATHQLHTAQIPFKLTDAEGRWVGASTLGTKVTKGLLITIDGKGNFVSADEKLASMIRANPGILANTYWLAPDKTRPHGHDRLRIKNGSNTKFFLSFNRGLSDGKFGVDWQNAGSLTLALKT